MSSVYIRVYRFMPPVSLIPRRIVPLFPQWQFFTLLSSLCSIFSRRTCAARTSCLLHFSPICDPVHPRCILREHLSPYFFFDTVVIPPSCPLYFPPSPHRFPPVIRLSPSFCIYVGSMTPPSLFCPRLSFTLAPFHPLSRSFYIYPSLSNFLRPSPSSSLSFQLISPSTDPSLSLPHLFHPPSIFLVLPTPRNRFSFPPPVVHLLHIRRAVLVTSAGVSLPSSFLPQFYSPAFRFIPTNYCFLSIHPTHLWFHSNPRHTSWLRGSIAAPRPLCPPNLSFYLAETSCASPLVHINLGGQLRRNLRFVNTFHVSRGRFLFRRCYGGCEGLLE